MKISKEEVSIYRTDFCQRETLKGSMQILEDIRVNAEELADL
jgi:hypothetical protein